MKEMGWSWEELYRTPERVFLSIVRIVNLQYKEQRKVESEAEISRKYKAARGMR